MEITIKLLIFVLILSEFRKGKTWFDSSSCEKDIEVLGGFNLMFGNSLKRLLEAPMRSEAEVIQL